MQLFDTLTQTKRPLEVRDEGKVSIYACGPTVYDAPHLGHARNALTYDILRRYLDWRGFEVLHVANVTDIDDNIINRAKDEGSTETEVAATWERTYIEAMDRLNVLHPHERPHATDYVDEMVEFIAVLMSKGVAYSTESGVYLEVASVPDYGALVHRTPDDLRESAGARVDIDTAKHDPLDFVLWKAAKPGEPTWPSPWGDGRPGWHIECVAMSLGILGPRFDIHGGGDDLAFPHHENERAEAVAGGFDFARYWVHHAMVNVSGTKMSKSLGNFTTVGTLLEQYEGRALRLLFLQTHYRKTMEINDEVMEQATAAVDRLDAMVRRAERAGVEVVGVGDPDISIAFAELVDDDLATPAGVALIFDTVRSANAALDAGDDARASVLVATVIDLAKSLGLTIGNELAANSQDDDTEINALVAERTTAREARDFGRADQIRDELAARGIVLEDTASGVSWHRS